MGAWIDDVTRAELMICLVVVEGDSYGVNFYAANTIETVFNNEPRAGCRSPTSPPKEAPRGPPPGPKKPALTGPWLIIKYRTDSTRIVNHARRTILRYLCFQYQLPNLSQIA